MPTHLIPDGLDTTATSTFLAGSLPELLSEAHNCISEAFRDITRISAFLLNSDTATLSHWADSNGRVLSCPADLASLLGNPALSRCGTTGRAQAAFIHTDPALEWAANGDTCPLLALPIRHQHQFFGFLVIESTPTIALPARITLELLVWGPLAASMVARGLESARAMLNTLRFAHTLTLMRDEETGQHQIRLRDYIRILTEELSTAHGLSERFIDELALFGPLHDIGKVGIADNILLKPGKLDQPEWEHMKEHVNKGRRLIERLASDFALHDSPGVDTLREVVACHHEYLDGSGYPDGRYGDAIPLSARIVTVADIFDALTWPRPYRPAWSPEAAFDELGKLAGHCLDRECVSAMSAARPRIIETWQGHHMA